HNMPKQDDYVAARYDQSIIIDVEDAVGDPKELTLHYWVEADHDINRNGIADSDEYVNRSMVNTTTAESKRFFTTIDDSRNPNLASVSYYVTGNDPAGNLLESGEGPGFSSDLATYRTRKDMESVFTGLHWSGHNDGDAIFAGTEQTITAGLVDANGIIDFEIISLIFDFEGPDPERDKQSISFSGRNNTFWSDSDYIDILQNSKATTISNDTGLPWILIDFHFKVSWDWPDEDISDLAFEYKQLGASMRRIEFVDRTFHVENDLVLDPTSYTITDVMHPRVGPIDSSTSIRADDRIQWTGRVVYENSQTPPPNNLGIVVEVFDGVQMWSDGSLTENGDYMIEVPLSAAPTLASAETRTFLTGITGIPGRGEDMTRDSVSTTLQLSVDHTPPRVIHRILPVDIIDIGIQEDLTQVNVAFLGTEECVNDPSDQRCSDLAQAPQQVHWIMRDGTTTIAAGYSVLSMELQGNLILWTGTVDLTSGGLVIPRSGYIVGFYVTGEDAAGNTFPQTSNSESDPVREPTNLDNDLDLAWVTLGADKSPELRAIRIDTNQERVSVGTDVELRMYLTNLGGPLNASFDVSFFAGDATEPFNTQRIDKIEEGDTIYIDAIWDAEEGIERIRVVVDSSNEIDEIDEQDNAISVGIDVAYGWGLGWIEQARQNPLTILLIVIALIVVPTVTYVSIRQMNKGAVDDDFVNLLFEDDQYEDDDDEYDDDEYDDDDGGWE
ncbi:MAG: CARDB domain-containing protein, partial [Candidatus Thermoplasmatota archaeon]|nr:CARDB domain-containing protein [Candidatus Thermoplasmatota archaeon]